MSEIRQSGRRLAIVTLLPGWGPTGVETHFRAVARRAELAGVTVERIDPHGIASLRLLALRALCRVARICRARRLLAHLSRYSYRLGIRMRLRALLREAGDEPLTLYAQDSMSSAICARERRSPNTRLVTVVHFNHSEAEELVDRGLTAEGGRLWRQAWQWERRSVVGADVLVFVSDYMRQHVVSRYGPEIAEKSCVISNFPEHEIAGTPERPERDLVAIGTLEARKNQRFLLALLRACADLGRRYTLTIVGDGPDRDKLERQAADLGLADQVDFLGRLKEGHLQLGRHRALVHAALSENLPLTLIEALSHGKPVLAVPVGGIPEIVRDGREGLFLDAEDIEASARTVIGLLENEALLSEMGAAARRRYEERFRPEPLFATLLAVLFP